MPAPVVTVAQMREWEQATWDSGRTPFEVISRVGHLVAQRMMRLTRKGDFILILAGKGHNGDDARHSSQHLRAREVYLINVTDPTAALHEFSSQLTVPPALILDGIFGIGLNRPLDGAWQKLIAQVNRSGLPTVSIDVPSGLNAQTGEPQGEAIRADLTLTLAAPKAGLLNSAAFPYAGQLEVIPDIGLVPFSIESNLQWVLREDFCSFRGRRPVDSHKGSFGHLLIFGGSTGFHGASILAAKGALRAQPGLVTVYTPEPTYIPVASQLQMAMVHPWHPTLEPPASGSAILCGPGMAAVTVPGELKKQICRLWEESRLPMIADASALDWLPPSSNTFDSIRVITPHPGEAARLLKSSVSEIKKDRPAAVRELSKRYGGCLVVLKGHQTISGSSSGDLFINSSGNPGLAQGGSGDALAGFIGGLLAQPLFQKNAPQTVRYAVWQHGASADYLQSLQNNWTVEELLQTLGNIEPAGR